MEQRHRAEFLEEKGISPAASLEESFPSTLYCHTPPHNGMEHFGKQNRKSNQACAHHSHPNGSPWHSCQADCVCSRTIQAEERQAINQDDLSILVITGSHLYRQSVYQPALAAYQLPVDTGFSLLLLVNGAAEHLEHSRHRHLQVSALPHYPNALLKPLLYCISFRQCTGEAKAKD